MSKVRHLFDVALVRLLLCGLHGDTLAYIWAFRDIVFHAFMLHYIGPEWALSNFMTQHGHIVLGKCV